jgi:hypothetical protein
MQRICCLGRCNLEALPEDAQANSPESVGKRFPKSSPIIKISGNIRHSTAGSPQPDATCKNCSLETLRILVASPKTCPPTLYDTYSKSLCSPSVHRVFSHPRKNLVHLLHSEYDSNMHIVGFIQQLDKKNTKKTKNSSKSSKSINICNISSIELPGKPSL